MSKASRISRRRLTIAALLLLVLGGGLWWSMRPRIDPRLVGTWKCSQPPQYSMVLHPDGTYERFDTGPDDLFGPLTWRVDGDFLVLMKTRRDGTRGGLLERLEAIYNELRGRKVYFQRLRILEITPTTIRLEESMFGGTFSRVN